MHPPVRAVAAPQAVLGLEDRRSTIPARIESGVERRSIFGMYPLEPLVGARPDLVGFATDHGLPAVGENDTAVEDIPIPEPVVGGTRGEGIALLAGTQRTDRALLLERHAEQCRALEVEVVPRVCGRLEGSDEGQQAPVFGGGSDREQGGDLRIGRSGKRDERGRGEGLDPDVASDREAIAGVRDEGAGKLDGHVLARARRCPPKAPVARARGRRLAPGSGSGRATRLGRSPDFARGPC